MIPFFSLDDEFHYGTEGGDHSEEGYQPGLHRQYSTDGEIYLDTTIHNEDDYQPESSSYGHGHYDTADIREQSKRYQARDRRYSYHTDESADRGNRPVSFAVIQCSENVKDRLMVKLLFLSFPSVAVSAPWPLTQICCPLRKTTFYLSFFCSLYQSQIPYSNNSRPTINRLPLSRIIAPFDGNI